MANEYVQLKKNTVSADAQVTSPNYVSYINPEGKGKRILFLGNSITLHAPKEDIGWFKNCGMAASAEDKDYVHKMVDMINKVSNDCAFCICKVVAWERGYLNGTCNYDLFKEAKDFKADIIIMRFVENCPMKEHDGTIFKRELDRILEFFKTDDDTKIIMSTGFWHHPGDKEITEYANEKNLPLALLGDLGEKDEMKAIGLFEHTGVAAHPGDLGMEKMAERLFEKLAGVL